MGTRIRFLRDPDSFRSRRRLVFLVYPAPWPTRVPCAARTESAGAQAEESRNLDGAQDRRGWARWEAVRTVLCTGRTPSMRVRGAQWAEARRSQKEREKQQLIKSAVSGLEVDRRTVDREGGERDQTAATTVAFSLVNTSAGPRKVVVPPPPEIGTSSARDHLDPKQEILKDTITKSASPNLGVQQRSLERPTEDEEGRATKRKHLPTSFSNKSKVLVTSVGTNTSGSIKETSSIIEKVPPLNPQSNVVDQSTIPEDSGHVWSLPLKSSLAQAATPGVRFRMPGVGWHCVAAAPKRGCELNSPSVSNVLLNKPGRASLPKVVHHAQSISEKEQDHEAIKEVAFIPVHNTEEINSEVIWEQIQKLLNELMSSSVANSTKLLEEANKLVIENKRLKDGQILLLQQVKDQKQMIDELSKQNRALVQKCAEEVDCHKEETAQLIKDKEELQRRVSQANELLKLMTGALCHGS